MERGPDTTSASLVARVANPADQVAWRRFDSRYGELVVRYGRRLGLQHTDAEDIRQIVMARLARVLRQFHYSPRRGRFRGFLGRVVRNEIARHFRRPQTTLSGVLRADRVADVSDGPAPPDDSWEREWTHHHLRLAMQHIRSTTSPLSLEVFERLLAGESVESVAEAFAMTVEGVHKIKQRVRDRLKERVAAQIRAEDGEDEGI
jgi:RNA polymerase sigma-70 factor (ECF subfamily)